MSNEKLTFFTSSGTGSLPRPIPAKLWRVTPPILQAARPVDAVTAVRSGSLRYLLRSFVIISLMSTDFPVPAEPVKNMLFPRSTTASRTALCSSLKKTAAILEVSFAFEFPSLFWVFLYSCRSSFCSALMVLSDLFHGSAGLERLGVTKLFFLSSGGSSSSLVHGSVRGFFTGGWKWEGGDDDHGNCMLLGGAAASCDMEGRSG